MCDTLVASPKNTEGQLMLFAKNSDRQRNEAHTIEIVPRAGHAPGASVRCTYIAIPQVPLTHAMLLCRPYWIWGAEMGANEHGVVIGNQGLPARAGVPDVPALTGMDLIRLALERAVRAAEAVEVITGLLEEYGQGGNCGHIKAAYYHNGFMVADNHEAFVIETVGRQWLVERVQGVRAISNRYSINAEPYRQSSGLAALIHSFGGRAEPGGYVDGLADSSMEHIGNSDGRRTCNTSLMQARTGRLGAADMMELLRNHSSAQELQLEWNTDCLVKRTICMHAGEDRVAQTTGSMVSVLRQSRSLHWVTGSAAPCISIFKPVLIEAPLPTHGAAPSGWFDSRALWWRHEWLHRLAVMDDFHRFSEEIRPERDALEATFRLRMEKVLAGATTDECSRVIADCWNEAAAMEDRWLDRLRGRRVAARAEMAAWLHMSQLAGLDLTSSS